MRDDDPRGAGCGCEPRSTSEVEPAVEAAIDALRKHEDRIAERLRDPAFQRRFLVSPKDALKSAGIALPPALAHHLRRILDRNAAAVEPPGDVVLPDGRRLRPRVVVSITDGKRGARHGR